MEKCSKWNQLTMALVALGLSSSACAAYMDTPKKAGIPLTIPRQTASWAIGGELFYGRFSNEDFQYALTADPWAAATGGDLSEYRAHSVEPDNNWGGGLDITYHFAGLGRDVRLSYERYRDKESDGFTFDGDRIGSTRVWWSALGGPTTDPQGPHFFLFGPDFNISQSDSLIHGKSLDKHQAVDLVFGQKISVGKRVSFHIIEGLRYAALQTRDKVQFSTTNLANPSPLEYDKLVREDFYSSKFKGLGPRLGIDAAAHISKRTSLTGRLSVSGLVGHSEHRVNYPQVGTLSIGGGLLALTVENHSFRADSQTRIVP